MAPSVPPSGDERALQVARWVSIVRLPLHVGTTGLWLACLQPGTPLWLDPWLDLAAAAAAFALFALETVAVQFLGRTAALSQRLAFGVAIALSLLLLAVPMHEWTHEWREGDSLLLGFGGGPRLWEFGLLDAAIALALGGIAAWSIPGRITRWLQPLWTVATIGAWTLASA